MTVIQLKHLSRDLQICLLILPPFSSSSTLTIIYSCLLAICNQYRKYLQTTHKKREQQILDVRSIVYDGLSGEMEKINKIAISLWPTNNRVRDAGCVRVGWCAGMGSTDRRSRVATQNKKNIFNFLEKSSMSARKFSYKNSFVLLLFLCLVSSRPPRHISLNWGEQKNNSSSSVSGKQQTNDIKYPLLRLVVHDTKNFISLKHRCVAQRLRLRV